MRGVVRRIEVGGDELRNSLLAWDWRRCMKSTIRVFVSPVNLIVTKSSVLKNFIVLKNLEQYRSSRLQSAIKLLWTMNIYLALYYQAMSTITTTTVSHRKIESNLSKKSSNNSNNNHRF